MSSVPPLPRSHRITGRGGSSEPMAAVFALLAHELRNPLTPMRLRIQLARVGRSADLELTRCFDVMERQLDYLQRMVDDLASWARPAGTVDLVTRHQVDLADIALACGEALAPLTQARHLALSLDVQEGPHLVIGDEDRLMQLLINLLVNAFKYSMPGGAVVLRLWRCEGEELLQVSDTGIGIEAGQLAHIFEPFFTVPGSGAAGLGLGLAVVRQVAAAHGGWVRAQSPGVDRGATFTAGLPALLN